MKKEVIIKKTKGAVSKTVEVVKKKPIVVAYAVGGIIGAVIIYKIVKGLTTSVDQIFNGDPNIDNNVGGTGGDTNLATITDQVAINFAQQLLDAMNEKAPLYGTDENTIKAVFLKLNNGHDFIKVFKAFGMKDYNGNNSPPEGIWSNLDSYEKRNLIYWLKKELHPFWDKKVFNIVKKKIELAGFVFS
ncbi:MAG: hypothetical protein JKY30_10900 [Flavobacteriales bacterium]|nr:hypothetical protein [Flavobacteriales bacterium]